MDVSGETADLVVKESIQATESAVKLAGTGLKNVAALLLALSKEDYKVVGKTSSRRLARDPSPAEVVRVKQEDMGKFQKLARELGILYFFARKKGSQGEYVNVVSTQNYAAQLNAALEALGYTDGLHHQCGARTRPFEDGRLPGPIQQLHSQGYRTLSAHVHHAGRKLIWRRKSRLTVRHKTSHR